MLKATSENFPEHKMAANIRGKYTLRRKEPEPDETLDLNYGIDSDIDEESDEEDYQPLVQFVAAPDDDEDVIDADLAEHNDDDNPHNPQAAAAATVNADAPDGWDDSAWKQGDKDLSWLGDFTVESGFLIDIPEDAKELDFLSLFLTDAVLGAITTETNRYAKSFLDKAKAENKLKEHSRFKLWPDDGISVSDLKSFIALTFYFGLVKKDNVKSYWSTDNIYDTPFPKKVMGRDKFFNIFAFLHLCNNEEYVDKGNPGYDPCKKLGFFFDYVTRRFGEVWAPRQHLSIDEGCIPFKGRIHFRCYNPSKIDKYHIKTFKLVDSSNNYCLKFRLYTGTTNYPESKFGKTYDLVFHMVQDYLDRNYILYMDNFYSSPYLFFELKKSNTAAVGTLRLNRKGIPNDIKQAKFKNKGDKCVMSYNDEMTLTKTLDRKVVTFLSTKYNAQLVDTRRKDRETGEPIKKPLVMTKYNKYMGGVDANDQLLKYSHFSKRTIKWWKKVFFRILNVCMVNAFVLFKEYRLKHGLPIKFSHTDFRLAVIRQIVNESVSFDNVRNRVTADDFERLTGKHFISKIPVPENHKKKSIQRICKVCSTAERQFFRRNGEPKRKRAGHETIYECKLCNVSLCLENCFEIFHTQKYYVDAYIDRVLKV